MSAAHGDNLFTGPAHWWPHQGAIPFENPDPGAFAYIGPPPGLQPSAGVGTQRNTQAFLVQIGGGRELRTHYHPVAQFQVFVAGDGTLLRHPVTPGVVHYVDPYVPYGPIVSGPQGIAYLTLRGIADSGAYFMPENRAQLRTARNERGAVPRRNEQVDLSVEAPDEVSGVWHDRVRDRDGLRMSSCRLEPGATIGAPAIEGEGAYLIVLSGSIRGDNTAGDAGAAYGPGSITFRVPGAQSGVPVRSGLAGARVALVQLPDLLSPGPRDARLSSGARRR